jgi:hypothetical protein
MVVAPIITAAIVAASAIWMPFVRPQPSLSSGSLIINGAYPILTAASSLRQRIDLWTATHERVEVATWGDHLQPWHIRISTPFASRLTWFEKGRVYSRNDVKAPPGASSAAVSCWSFSTGCWSMVGSKLTGPLPAPPELTESNQQQRTWATAIEERGWPFPAFTCRLSAPMDRPDAPVYEVEGGVWAEQTDSPTRGGEIQTLRAIPATPMWPGLIANSLIFTAALYLVSFVPALVLSRFRNKRGHCPRCNYNLVGQLAPGCPECGWNRAAAAQSPPTAGPPSI